MSQYALPDDYPFPLYVGATTDNSDASLGSANANLRDGVDPGNGSCAKFRGADGVWQAVTNHDAATTINDPVENPLAWTYPFHSGASLRNAWPDNTYGDYSAWDVHWLERIDPTVQGDLPFLPVILVDLVDGHVGALDGVFCTPRGGVLAAEQVVTISAVNYRVFSTRAKGNGMNYYAIIES